MVEHSSTLLMCKAIAGGAGLLINTIGIECLWYAVKCLFKMNILMLQVVPCVYIYELYYSSHTNQKHCS